MRAWGSPGITQARPSNWRACKKKKSSYFEGWARPDTIVGGPNWEPYYFLSLPTAWMELPTLLHRVLEVSTFVVVHCSGQKF